MGVVCGMEAAHAKRHQELGLGVLHKALAATGQAPKRTFLTVKEFEDYFQAIEEFIIDGTEHRIQRPTDPITQKECYSGKKTPTRKSMVISDQKKRIHDISHSWPGTVHDYKMLQQEFPPNKNGVEKFDILVDLGYLGLQNDDRCKHLRIPNKKPKHKELDETQKEANRALAAERVSVEHGLGGMKRFRLLSERLRWHAIDL
jgi:hypothetical protein